MPSLRVSSRALTILPAPRFTQVPQNVRHYTRCWNPVFTRSFQSERILSLTRRSALAITRPHRGCRAAARETNGVGNKRSKGMAGYLRLLRVWDETGPRTVQVPPSFGRSPFLA